MRLRLELGCWKCLFLVLPQKILYTKFCLSKKSKFPWNYYVILNEVLRIKGQKCFLYFVWFVDTSSGHSHFLVTYIGLVASTTNGSTAGKEHKILKIAKEQKELKKNSMNCTFSEKSVCLSIFLSLTVRKELKCSWEMEILIPNAVFNMCKCLSTSASPKSLYESSHQDAY